MGFLDRVKASFSQAMGGKASLDLELAQQTAAPGDTLEYRVVLVTTGRSVDGCSSVRVCMSISSLVSRFRVRFLCGASQDAQKPGQGHGTSLAQPRLTLQCDSWFHYRDAGSGAFSAASESSRLACRRAGPSASLAPNTAWSNSCMPHE